MNVASWRALAFAAAAWLGARSPSAQPVVLNELMAVNTTAHPDIVDYEDYPDWIELRNTTDLPVSLDRFTLSDDPGEPGKWPFPAGASLPPHGFLIVWADGHNAGPGTIRPRGYWPWRSFAAEGYHANFALSGEGETLVLAELEAAPTTSLILAAQPPPTAALPLWRYSLPDTDPGTGWREPAFDDTAWPSGPAQLGFGDGDEATALPSENNPPTAYFRMRFHVENPGAFESLNLRLLADDGAIVYFNGQEVVRLNMPAGAIEHYTRAVSGVSGGDESVYHNFAVPPARLVSGENVVAVEVHQSSLNSTDLSFDLSLEGRLIGVARVVDTVVIPKQIADISYGRDPENPTAWRQMARPTPGATNQGPYVPDLRQASGRPAYSQPAGFYAEPPTVSLTAQAGDILYTRDGSLPRLGSAVYTGPLTLLTNTVLRARVVEPGKVPGPVETRTYFVNEPPGRIPIVSFAADPETLFGDRIGIYYNQHEPSTLGGRLRDVYKNKEIPSSLEWFEPGGQLGFRVDAGTTIGAENSWAVAQRPLNVHTRSKFGFDTIPYDLFPGSGLGDHTFVTLRNGGDNWTSDMLRDALLPFISDGRLRVETAAYRPAAVFINGVYWGLHELRQRYDEGYFFAKYHLHVGEYDHLGYAHVDSSALKLERIEGETNRWVELLAFLDTHDLAIETNWARVEREIDLDSFIDWAAIEVYGMNISWRHNRQFWRGRQPDAQWRWLASDIDRAFNIQNLNGSGQLPSVLADDPIMRRLILHPDFKARFAQRFAAHLASTFAPARMAGIVDRLEAELAEEVPRHEARWGAEGGMTVRSRTDSLRNVRTFAQERPNGALLELARNLGLGGTRVLTVSVEPAEAGAVRINRVSVPAGEVRLFENLPFELAAEPAPGFKFAGWTGLLDSSSPAPATLTLAGDGQITARFEPSGEIILPNEIATDTVLATGAVYSFTSNLTVRAEATLTIEPGVQLLVPPGAHLRIQGALQVFGTEDRPVRIEGRNGAIWGGLSFEQPGRTSILRHATIKGATRGIDPTKYPAAISGLDAHLVLESLDLTQSEFPVFVRRGSTIMRGCRVYNPHTGDGINVKGGFAEVTDCIFLGNTSPDTDAIDYDGVVDGVIRNNRMYRFAGSNSDAIDCGENCRNLLVEGNHIYFMSDKGISVGQASSVILRRNLVVGCNLGAGIKDTGSILTADQNTFVRNQIAVAVYEKNFGDGGGQAVLMNNIFSRSAAAPFTIDALSTLSVSYSLSDTIPLPGDGNLLADPRFFDPALLHFELLPESPARDTGDPAHPADADGSRADMGAPLRYAPADYPYPLRDTVVFNEVMSNFEPGNDWLELFNRTSAPADVGGWFVSDSGAELKKYRIAPGTIIPPQGFLLLTETQHFGAASTDPGRLTPFALKDTGETLHLSSAIGDTLTGYEAEQRYEAGLFGITLGRYDSPGGSAPVFVPLAVPTPGAPNAPPKVGPIVISEIFYAPIGGMDAEFLEFLNINTEAVSAFDAARRLPWKFEKGIEFDFPADPPFVFAPNERVILVRNLTAFHGQFTIPDGTRVLVWTSGRLDNSGETIELSQPGPLSDLNETVFAQVERIEYGAQLPWPAPSASENRSLHRIDERGYGNTFLNWEAAPPSPGAPAPGGFERWEAAAGLPLDQRGEGDDPDLDGRPNLLEYALGSNPLDRDAGPVLIISATGGLISIEFPEASAHTGVVLELEACPDLRSPAWTPVAATTSGGRRRAAFPLPQAGQSFFRLHAHRSAL